MKGGLALCNNGVVESLELNIGGIMSNVPCGTIASKYEQLSDKVKDMGCHLKSPFMTLSFMSLLVIPKLKLGDRGLFAIEKFKFVSLFE
jgi:adenine deaminase